MISPQTLQYAQPSHYTKLPYDFFSTFSLKFKELYIETLVIESIHPRNRRRAASIIFKLSTEKLRYTERKKAALQFGKPSAML